MLDVAHHRHTERRHMIRVKNALAAGLALTPVPVEFLLACADYLGYIVGRFTAQGRGNVERLAPRIAAAGDGEGARVVADIARTLGETEAAVADLLAGAGAFRRQGGDAVPELLAAGRRFVAFYDAVLASRKDPAQQIIDRYFTSSEYWALTDDVTPRSIETEDLKFRRVAGLAPAGITVVD